MMDDAPEGLDPTFPMILLSGVFHLAFGLNELTHLSNFRLSQAFHEKLKS